MQSTHTFTAESAVFDKRNLMAAAGLVPVLELAEQSGQLIRGRRCDRRTSRIVLSSLPRSIRRLVWGRYREDAVISRGQYSRPVKKMKEWSWCAK
ncbi:hypothetical protein EEB14_58325 [Rhodococcus sp. WS4]|nr:hypothetical protein EEB14_58325 [Rhodococcus sp. WS4]